MSSLTISLQYCTRPASAMRKENDTKNIQIWENMGYGKEEVKLCADHNVVYADNPKESDQHQIS